ncbi:3,4-dihydroxy-2-butanone-4-phosphate synthase [Bacillus piscicola]|uniref:3,4-dihydroxy-2-butanone-4-phosphate synthase n=1 Tax=Bacillus piscicola TaxID=1632684 RepID=UPI001F097B86|nr:3,4-dihydroxy-2-butanone-4-phosphate synthase [Bacillus piscicola]
MKPRKNQAKKHYENNLTILFDDVHTGTSYLTGVGERADGRDINFMINYGKGLVYACITKNTANRLNLSRMDRDISHKNTLNTSTVSIDYKTTTTGISAFERADTIKNIHTSRNPGDFKRPGHIFPLIGQVEDLLTKPDIVAAALELASNFIDPIHEPTSFISEILDHNGEVSSIHDVKKFAVRHSLEIIKVSDVVHNYLQKKEWLEVIEVTDMRLFNHTLKVLKVHNHLYPSSFTVYLHTNTNDYSKRTAFHTECISGDVLGVNHECDCHKHLKEYMYDLINGQITGVVYRQKYNESSIPLHYENTIEQQLIDLVTNKMKARPITKDSMTV